MIGLKLLRRGISLLNKYRISSFIDEYKVEEQKYNFIYT